MKLLLELMKRHSGGETKLLETRWSLNQHKLWTIKVLYIPEKGNIRLCWLKDNKTCLFAPTDKVCEPIMVEEMSTLIRVLLTSAWIWLHQWPKKSQRNVKWKYLEKKWPGERRNANPYSRSPPLRCWGDQPLADVRYQHCLKHRQVHHSMFNVRCDMCNVG